MYDLKIKVRINCWRISINRIEYVPQPSPDIGPTD